MNLSDYEAKCLNFAHLKYTKKDHAHDILHAKRVLSLTKKIQSVEGGNLKVLIPGALFHDIVMIPKDHPKSNQACEKSAKVAKLFLTKEFSDFLTKEEIDQVYDIINTCSFSKNLPKNSLEGHILQDADGLEAVGSVAIMRTFYSGALMQRPFYHEEDPFCLNRQPEAKMYSLDLFFERLFKIKERLHTQTALKIANDKEKILHAFIDSLKEEL